MKKKYFDLLLSVVILLTYISNAFAADLNCPPEYKVKSVKLIKAIRHRYDPDVWNFASNAITDNDNNWNIWFGTFLTGIKTPEEALRQGQAYFNKSQVIIKNPISYEGHAHMTFCDYTPTGRLYWISAVNPPEYENA